MSVAPVVRHGWWLRRLVPGAMLVLAACPESREAGQSHVDTDGSIAGDLAPADREDGAGSSDPVAAREDAATEAGSGPAAANDDAAAEAGGTEDAGTQGSWDSAMRDAEAADAEPPLHDASALPDTRPNRPDAAMVTCDSTYAFPCSSAIPDRTSIGSLGVSTLPRPDCPEALPIADDACSLPGLRCGYGNRARSDCRKVFECSFDKQWVDASPACYLPPPSHCPDTRPEPGSACDIRVLPAAGLPVCEYGATVTCTCGPRFFRDGSQGWQCNVSPALPDCPPVAPNHGEGCAVQGSECLYGPRCQRAGGRWACRAGVWAYAGEDSVCGQD